MSPEKAYEIIAGGEDYNRELKSAHNSFSKDKDLPDYCAALCNERGGYLLLGVEDDGTICGTNAFQGTYNTLANYLFQQIKKRVNVYEVFIDSKRILAFDCPPRNPGEIVKSSGRYRQPMRLGESLAEMDDDTARSILAETLDDFTSFRSNASLQDVDASAQSKFLERLAEKRGIAIELLDAEQTLKDLRLTNNRKLTNAGLLILGTKSALDNLLPQAEIILEYRQDKDSTNFDFRRVWRAPLVLALDEIWQEINARNTRTPLQEGLFQRDIPAFDEKSIREAVLNAVIHRDYRIATASIFIRISGTSFEITSPGGFLPGITPENILTESEWRNRTLAEALQHIGWVERSGQGLDDIFSKTISSGKGEPTIVEIERRKVRLNIPCAVQDAGFIKFIEAVLGQKQITLTPSELVELEEIRHGGYLHNPTHKDKFFGAGIIERIGRGRGTKYILSQQFYVAVGKQGVHTRLVGINRAARKHLILEHIAKHGRAYNHELQDAFPDMTMKTISILLAELRRDGEIHHEGSPKLGYWVSNDK